MSNGLIMLMAGLGIWAVLIASICALVGLGRLEQEDEDGERAERNVARIVEATQPAPLEPERRHVRAGTAYGSPL
jgi:hypothetical protein